MSFKPRPYQEEALNNILYAFNDNKKVLFQGSTGMGKTFIFTMITKHYSHQLNKKVLILCHRSELVEQTIHSLARIGVTSEKVISTTRKLHHNSDAYVAMIETANNRLQKDANFFKDVGLIICDECHILIFNKVFDFFPQAKILGCTATPVLMQRVTYWKCDVCRAEYNEPGECHSTELMEWSKPLTMSNFYDTIVVGPSIKFLIDEGYLVPEVSFIEKYVNEDDLKIDSRTGDFTTASQDEAYNKKEVVFNIVENYKKLCLGKKTMIFTSSTKSNISLVEEFKEQGIENVRSFDSVNNKASERKELLEWFKNTQNGVLVNTSIFTTGFDDTTLEAIIMARSTMSLSLYLQMCLDLETEILTDNGWKKHNEVSKGDVVASFDISTKEIVYEPCLDKVFRDISDNESFYSLKSPFVDLRVTNNHNLITRAISGKGYNVFYKLREAQDVSLLKSGYEIPIAGYTNKEDVKELSDSDLRFIGWVLSDGTINKHTNGICISQAVSQPEYLHKSIIDSINGCGFKYNTFEAVRTGELSHYSNLIQYNISYGKPRGTDKHLTGWSRLEKYLDKNISNELMNISRRQLGILLETINYGDGAKRVGVDYTPRSFSIAMGINKKYAERLQILCITNGYKANLKKQKTNSKAGYIYILHIKDRDYASIKGSNEKDGNRLQKELEKSKEKVWCVETNKGTIITRRNGKVTIMGNCGRGGRTTDKIFKDRFIFIDGGGNIARHLEWSDPSRDWEKIFYKGIGEDRAKKMQLDAPATCENCGMLYAKSIKICPDCGHEEEVPDKVEKQVEGIDSVLEPIRKIPPPNGEMIYKYVKGLGENIYKALKIMENQILELFVMYRVGQKQYLSNLNDGRLDKRLGQLIRPVYFTLIKKEDLIPEKGFKRKISTLIENVKSKLKKMYNIE